MNTDLELESLICRKRNLYIYSKLDSISDSLKDKVITTWYETTKEISEGKRDVHTTQMYALSGAQETFDEIYIDGVIIWPNEKQNITDKELRRSHNLCKIFGCWFRYRRDNEPI